MALTVTKEHGGVMGDRRFWIGTITPASSDYPNGGTWATNGYSLPASTFGFALRIDYLEAQCSATATATPRMTVWDGTNNRLHFFTNASPPVELANNADASAQTYRLLVFGK